MSGWDKDNPLNRIKGESRAANSALRDYYLMGAGRSLSDLLDQYTHQTLAKHSPKKPPTQKLNTLKRWSADHAWQARVDAQKAIDDAIALEQFRERHMSGDEVLAHLSDIASDKKGAGFFFQYDEDGDVNGLDWSKIQQYGYLIKTITFTRNGPKLELYSRLDALDKMARHHGLFTDNIKHSGEISTGDELSNEEKAERIAGIIEKAVRRANDDAQSG